MGGLVVDTLHDKLAPECSEPDTMDLVSRNAAYGGASFGKAIVVNNETDLGFIISPLSGLSVAKAALWWQLGGCDPNDPTAPCNVPLRADGSFATENCPRFVNVNPVRAPYSLLQPISTLHQTNTFVLWAELVTLDANGVPVFDEKVWAISKDGPGGASMFDYTMTRCPNQTCDPWLNSPNSCSGGQDSVTCAVPTGIGPGDDLSAFECGNGKGQVKVNVCHLPPGNPANMQEICIAVSALPAHIIDFKPANDPCMGHHSGCHLGPCDPCGPGSTAAAAGSLIDANCPGN